MGQESFTAGSSASLAAEIDALKCSTSTIPDEVIEQYMQEKPDFQRRLVRILGDDPGSLQKVADVCQDTLEWHMLMGSTPPFQVEPELAPAEAAVRERIREEIRLFVRELRQKYL